MATKTATKPALPALELNAIGREAYEAFDFSDERVRFDTLGRRWEFGLGIAPPSISVLRLTLSRLDKAASTTIPTSTVGCDRGLPACIEAVTAMSEAFGA